MKAKFLSAWVAMLFASCAHAGGPETVWEYEGEKGSRAWGKLDSAFSACGVGKRQSPINIEEREAERGGLKPIPFSYKAGPGEILNNGHTIQVNLTNSGSARFEGLEYRLVQFHFHTPSEEKINGMASHMVAHLVHRAGDTKLGVVAILIKLGKENAALKPVFDNLPPSEGKTAPLASFNPADLLPADPTYFAYIGSLTTPPCTEDVKWHVMKTPIEISYAQLAAFKKLYKMNARHTQATNGRRVQVLTPDAVASGSAAPAAAGAAAPSAPSAPATKSGRH
jgi:carbonic anhydrase